MTDDRARVKVRFLTRPSSSALPESETLLGAKDFFIVAVAVDFVNEMNEPPDREIEHLSVPRLPWYFL